MENGAPSGLSVRSQAAHSRLEKEEFDLCRNFRIRRKLALANKGHTGMRFVAVQDPTDQWLVYDELTELPVEENGRLLIGLSQAEAEQLAFEANIQQALVA